MLTARRPSSGETVHMCGQDGFHSYKGHILLAWVLPLSRKNLFFEALQWGRMFLAEIDLSLTAVRRLWLLRPGDAPLRKACNSCHVGTLLCRDCSHKDSVSLGSLEEHMYTKRQSQISVSIPDIIKAVRQPWMVRWSSRIADPDSWLTDCTLKSIFNWPFTNNRLFSKRSVRLAQAERMPSLVKGESDI